MIYIIKNSINKEIFIGETEDSLPLLLSDVCNTAYDGMQDTLSRMIREVGKRNVNIEEIEDDDRGIKYWKKKYNAKENETYLDPKEWKKLDKEKAHREMRKKSNKLYWEKKQRELGKRKPKVDKIFCDLCKKKVEKKRWISHTRSKGHIHLKLKENKDKKIECPFCENCVMYSQEYEKHRELSSHIKKEAKIKSLLTPEAFKKQKQIEILLMDRIEKECLSDYSSDSDSSSESSSSDSE